MNVPMLVTRFLRRGVRLYGKKTAVVCGDERFTYAEYGARVNQLSSALRGLGIDPGDRVAYLGPNCHRLLEAYYGVPRIGAILVCLNIRLSSTELRSILNDAEPTAILVDWEYVHLIAPIVADVPSLRHCVLLNGGPPSMPVDWTDYESLLANAPAEPLSLPDLDENDVAEIFYTSGTTGRPRGVMLTHRNLYTNAMAWIIGANLRDTDVQLHSVPLFHVNGWGTPHAVTGMGGTHVMVRQFRPEHVFAAIERERVTVGAMVPTMLNSLLNYPDYRKYDLRSWQKVIIGGAPCPLSFVKGATEQFGLEVVVGYGMTEVSPLISMANLKSYLRDLPLEEQYQLKTTVGVELMGIELRVVDDKGCDVPKDGQTIGQIIVRGDNVMKGYWRDPEATAQVIRDGWLYTGDLATINAEDYVTIVDREKDIIISGGENIASTEVEDVLYTHPAVLEVAVIAVPDEKWGEIPWALVALKPGHEATAEALMRHCDGKLAAFKIPKGVEFIDVLPKTGTGKVLKRSLREPYWAGYDKRVH